MSPTEATQTASFIVDIAIVCAIFAGYFLCTTSSTHSHAYHLPSSVSDCLQSSQGSLLGLSDRPLPSSSCLLQQEGP